MHKSTKLIFILTILILFLPLSFAQKDFTSLSEVDLKIENTLSFSVEMGPEYRLEYLDLISSFNPRTYGDSQILDSFSTTHSQDPTLNGSSIIYRFNEQTLDKSNSFTNTFNLKIKRNQPKITSKVRYPLANSYSDKYSEYLNFSGQIDQSNEIYSVASSLTTGEDDTYIIASKIAIWIKDNIEYNLSTVLENPNQKSSEVILSKKGVCKEITQLYISMLRSIGIPSRVVSGYAYTDSEEIFALIGSNWGGHAWAEVMIGDTWVPFDLTYNQLGTLDPSHVVLDSSADLDSFLLKLDGKGFDITPSQPKSTNKFEVTSSKKINSQEDLIGLTITGPSSINLDSYGFKTLNIENNQNYYQVITLSVVKPKDLASLEFDSYELILKPNDKKVLYYNYKINTTLESGYEYTLPINFILNGIEFNSTVTAKESATKIKQIALPENKDTKKSFSSLPLSLVCEFSTSELTNIVICSIKNPNNFEINDLKLCLFNDCNNVNLMINEQKEISFETDRKTATIVYSYEDSQGTLNLELKVPKLEINKVSSNGFITINYNVKNPPSSYSVELVEGSNTLKESSKPSDSFILNSNNLSSDSLKLVLKQQERTLDSKVLDIELKTVPENTNTEKSFFQKIIDFFKNLFS